MATSIAISLTMAFVISSTLILSIISDGETLPDGKGPTGIPASDCLCMILEAILEGLNPCLVPLLANISGEGKGVCILVGNLNNPNIDANIDLGFLKSGLRSPYIM
jgi:hypothetical protein